ncbi:MAG: hypothetical protein ACI81W_001693 [Saprospiraceae bacterium]|jgi:hypothetical protein
MMKKNLKIFLSLMIFGLLAVSTSLAQNFPVATSTSDNGVTLTQNSPLVEKYEIDFSTFNWTAEIADQAAKYLDKKSNLITLEVDFPNSKLILTLDINNSQTSGWGLQAWNNHLSTVR